MSERTLPGTGVEDVEPIQSSDYDVQLSQEIDDNSTLHLHVTSGLDSLMQADFSIFYAEPDSGDYIFLGTDSDVDADWDKGIFSDRFNGTWITIGGEYVCTELIEQADDYNLYSIPAIVNGEETNIRATYNFESGKYEVLGTYDGVDDETGASGRDVKPLESGDEVQFVFPAVDENLDETEDYASDTIKWSAGTTMEDSDLMDGQYIYMMSVYDYFGNEYDGDPILVTCEDGYITEDELE